MKTKLFSVSDVCHSIGSTICVWAMLLLVGTPNAQAQYFYTTLSVPGAFSTWAYGVSGNDIVGFYSNYSNSSTSYYGFLYNGSSYTTLSVPGAVETWANGISGNDIVGSYMNSNSSYYGFLYNGSTYTTLSVPGAADTFASGISGNYIVGTYVNSSGNDYGFLYNGSTYTTLSVPGAEATCASGISDNNIVGYYFSSSAIAYGYLATPVPEPPALGLLAVAAAAFVVRWQRRHLEKFHLILHLASSRRAVEGHWRSNERAV